MVPLLQGSGANGKTTVMACVSGALGTYHQLGPDALLLGSAQRDESMMLRGARMALIEETPEAAHLNSVMLKKATSLEMTGHHLYAASTTWTTTHSLFINTNYTPVVNDSDDGTWRRLALVKFPYRYVKEPQNPGERTGDPTLRARIEDGDPDILKAALRWLVDGAKEWYASGKVLPEMPVSVARHTLTWRKETDLILAYWDDRLVADPQSYILSTDTFRDWEEWARVRGYVLALCVRSSAASGSTAMYERTGSSGRTVCVCATVSRAPGGGPHCLRTGALFGVGRSAVRP